MNSEDSIGSVCMKNEVSPGFTCACRKCSDTRGEIEKELDKEIFGSYIDYMKGK